MKHLILKKMDVYADYFGVPAVGKVRRTYGGKQTLYRLCSAGRTSECWQINIDERDDRGKNLYYERPSPDDP